MRLIVLKHFVSMSLLLFLLLMTTLALWRAGSLLLLLQVALLLTRWA
jgi:hypothetical protein